MARRAAATRRLGALSAHLVAEEKEEREPIDYDAIRAKYAAFREARLRSDGEAQYTSEIDDVRGGSYGSDPWAAESDHVEADRAPLSDEVEVLIIGGGFSALLTSAQLRARGVESIRIVEKGADVGVRINAPLPAKSPSAHETMLPPPLQRPASPNGAERRCI